MRTGWRKATVGEVCEFRYGESLKDSDRSGAGFPVYGSNGVVGHHDRALTSGRTIVIGRKGSYGEVNISDGPCWPIDTTYFVDASCTTADLRWLGYRLASLGLNTMNRAAAVPGLNREDAYRQELLLPSIEEQRRIAAILDKADELRAKRREALAHLDSLVQSIFLDMFGDPVVNSAGWPDRRVDGALAFLTYGHRFYDESYSESGTPVVRITDLNEAGDLDFSSMPRMALTEDERKAYRVNVGDLLFARSGATVGKVALVRTGDPECIAGAYFVWLRFGDEVHPEYARAVLTSARVRTMIAKQSRQAAQQNFSGPAIKRLPMPVPPAQLQAEFAVAVERVRTQTARHQQAGRDLDALFASLQQQAFSGAL